MCRQQNYCALASDVRTAQAVSAERQVFLRRGDQPAQRVASIGQHWPIANLLAIGVPAKHWTRWKLQSVRNRPLPLLVYGLAAQSRYRALGGGSEPRP